MNWLKRTYEAAGLTQYPVGAAECGPSRFDGSRRLAAAHVAPAVSHQMNANKGGHDALE